MSRDDDQISSRKYFSFPRAKEAFERGENVSKHLQSQLGVAFNTPEIIEIAYDLQIGRASCRERV